MAKCRACLVQGDWPKPYNYNSVFHFLALQDVSKMREGQGHQAFSKGCPVLFAQKISSKKNTVLVEVGTPSRVTFSSTRTRIYDYDIHIFCDADVGIEQHIQYYYQDLFLVYDVKL